MNSRAFQKADAILIPNKIDLNKWSVVACDQYTSEPEYWQEVSDHVGDAPSTLRITLPEVYLEQDGVADRICAINQTMQQYLDNGLFSACKDSYLYIERTLRDRTVRQGLIGVIDLMEYDFAKGSQSKVRATEGTVLERIPPRVRVREHAALELPHVMLLIDDDACAIIEPLADEKAQMQQVYSFDLMQDSGSICGYQVGEEATARIDALLAKLGDQQLFEEKYNLTPNSKGVLQYAVGDGNHSLATAKQCYENLRSQMSEEEWLAHPARYALVELVNLHSSALQFEPIHRVVFDVDPALLMKEMTEALQLTGGDAGDQVLQVIGQDSEYAVSIGAPRSNITVGSLQAFLDEYTAKHGGKVDYIHGDDVVRQLCCAPDRIGFLLPVMQKQELFPTVVLDGALPRKTFSMGHAYDKRFYLESRKIAR